MPILPSVIPLALLIPAALVVAFNWLGTIVSVRNACRGTGRLYPTIYLASALLTTLAYLINPQVDCRWMFLVPLADLSNHVLPWIAGAWIWETLKRGWARQIA